VSDAVADQRWPWWPLLADFNPYGRRRTLGAGSWSRPGVGFFSSCRGCSMWPCRSGWTVGAGCAKACPLRPGACTVKVIRNFGSLRLATVGGPRSCCRPLRGWRAQAEPGPAMAQGFFPRCAVWVESKISGVPTLFAPGLAGFSPADRTEVLFEDGVPHGECTVWKPPGSPVNLGIARSWRFRVPRSSGASMRSWLCPLDPPAAV